MDKALIDSGEISLLCDNPNIVAVDAFEGQQTEFLQSVVVEDNSIGNNACLQYIDNITAKWIKGLTEEQLKKIKRQRSLYGIPIPEQWIKVWRFILKEPALRDSFSAARGGRSLSSYSYIWNVWAEECIDKYLTNIEKELLLYVDAGYLYEEIGLQLLGQYGDEFWKPRKEVTKTTPGQVVNNYLYWKMPNSIARQELTEMALLYIKNSKASK